MVSGSDGLQAAIIWKPQELRKDELRTRAALAARKGTPQRGPAPGTAGGAPGSVPPSVAQQPALGQPPASTPGKCMGRRSHFTAWTAFHTVPQAPDTQPGRSMLLCYAETQSPHHCVQET